MLHINSTTIEGQVFTANDPNTTYLCIGYGQDPTSAANYVIGECWDQTNNRTKIKTFLLKDISFIGQLPKASH